MPETATDAYPITVEWLRSVSPDVHEVSGLGVIIAFPIDGGALEFQQMTGGDPGKWWVDGDVRRELPDLMVPTTRGGLWRLVATMKGGDA